MDPSNSTVPRTNFQLWRICAWAGPIYVITEALSWAWIAGFLPPPVEYLGAQEMYQYYIDNNLRIRIGMLLTLCFAPLYFVWSAVSSRLIQRSEGPDGVMSQLELLGGFGTVVVTWGSVAAWLSAAFDTELKSPQDIKAISDLAWMWFNSTAMVSVIQFVGFGTGFLVDRRPVPIMPKWLAWFTYGMAAALMLALFTPFFHSGPFAWHGLLTYYVGLGAYFLWISVASYFVLKAIRRLELEAEAGRSRLKPDTRSYP